MEKIFCISAGQLIVKKIDNKISRKNRYLNYGLLSLATTLKKEGWNPIQVQGHFDKPIVTLNKCINLGFEKTSSMPLLLSIPSFYAISWVNEFISLVKEINPKIKIILGGRWVISNRVDLMQKNVPESDVIIQGTADSRIVEIVSSSLDPKKVFLPKTTYKNGQYPSLDYSLLLERELYQPSIEVSRGCGMECSFCQEKSEKLLPLKSSQQIISDIESTIIHDNLNKMNLYFEASMFIPTGKWIEDLNLNREKKELNFFWRAESRVDTINPKFVHKLAESGLKVLDLGLESASLQQLVKMKKSSNPEQYLLRASRLLEKCYESGIAVKINILLSAGESERTINETIEWLQKHRKYITGVSVGPVIVFGWESEIKGYLNELFNEGATISHSPVVGINYLNLSHDMTYEKSIIISNEISSEFMTKENYFYLKSFSYFSRDYSYANFRDDISSENGKYSFSTKKKH